MNEFFLYILKSIEDFKLIIVLENVDLKVLF